MNKRKIIQISATALASNQHREPSSTASIAGETLVFALCSDGSLWELHTHSSGKGDWYSAPDIPQADYGEPVPVNQELVEALPEDEDALVNERFLAGFSGNSLGKLRNDRHLKRGFPFVKLGSMVRYRAGDIRAYIRSNVVKTSDQ